jgi:hypothetical protein
MTVAASNRSRFPNSKLGLGCVWTGSVLLLCLQIRAARASGASLLRVNWSNGNLSVSAAHAPLETVLAEIARQSGLVVMTATPSRRQVSVNFSGLPLRQALAQLMSRENYAIVERPRVRGGASVFILMILGRAPTTLAAGEVRASAKPSRDRLTALLEAIHSGGVNADKALREGVNDSDPNVRILTLQTLGERGESGADALRQAAQAEQPATRLSALEVISEQGNLDPMPALTEALYDPDIEVRGYAMQLLLQKDGPRAIPVLQRALDSDSDPGFRRFIGEALSSYNASHAPDTEIPTGER